MRRSRRSRAARTTRRQGEDGVAGRGGGANAAMNDRFNLQRFVDAQARVYEEVRRELRAGRKESHWMWFVFPQIAGLGQSSTSIRFAIASLEEARAYLAHPILGPRLRECGKLALDVEAILAL
jgi:uncharacterized protein (DUF1810 family)